MWLPARSRDDDGDMIISGMFDDGTVAAEESRTICEKMSCIVPKCFAIVGFEAGLGAGVSSPRIGMHSSSRTSLTESCGFESK